MALRFKLSDGRRRDAALSALLLLSSCGGTDESLPTLSAVEPPQAYSDEEVVLTLTGGPFRPSVTIDTSSGGASLSVTPFDAFLLPAPPASDLQGRPLARLSWVDDQTLSAEVPRGVPDGLYDVQVRDPRGQLATLSGAFRSLGRDTEPPQLTLLQPQPGSLLAADSPVEAVASATDGHGQLRVIRWTASSPTLGTREGSCELPQRPHQADCPFSFVAPRGPQVLEPLTIRVEAEDVQGHVAIQTTGVQIAWRPIGLSFAPVAGPAYGMTHVTMYGQGFVASTRVLIDGTAIEPSGGIVENGSVIRGWTLPHVPGVVEISVATGNGETAAGTFEFVAPPVVRDIDPAAGPAAGANIVTIVGSHFRPSTRFYVGEGFAREELSVTDIVGPNRIRALMPPGMGVVSLFAVDLLAGEGTLPRAYTYTAPSPPP